MRGGSSDLFLAGYDPSDPFLLGGLFLDVSSIPISFTSLISVDSNSSASCLCKSDVGGDGVGIYWKKKRSLRRNWASKFMSVGLSVDEDDNDGLDRERIELLARYGEEHVEKEKKSGPNAFNTANHLWAGAVAAMVSRTFVAPLERLKLEYIVREEQRDI